MIKLFVFDMDGTALPYGDASLSPHVLDRLAALQDSGVQLAVASGRGPEELRRLLAPLKRPIYVIGHDGALAFEGDRAVYRRPIAPEAVRSFFRLPQNRERTLVLYGESCLYLRRGNGDREARADLACPAEEITKEYAIREPIYKVAAYGSYTGRALPVDGAMRRTRRTDAAEEYVCAYANKGVALSDLQVRLPVSVFDTAAAGDGQADLPLFARAALSFAPDGAPEEVKRAAQIVGSFPDFLSALVKTTEKPL
ncbi:MAG: HAD family phosphatase [Clostridia bacterium]|nr:HAD family phosphatase [Clostridia bacterium]